jgi:FkbM family methyltransferase
VSIFLMRIGRGLRHLEYSDEFRRCFSVFRRPVRMIAGYLGLPISYPFTCETTAGTKVRIAGRMDLVTTWIIYLRHEYTVEPDDEIIIDCGANIGVFALYAASSAPRSRVFAVEPFPSTFQDLCENVKLNRLDDRVTCVSIALSASDGMVNMYAAPHVPSQARQVIRPSGSDTVSVPAMSLSSLLGRIGVDAVDMLKMDIEGSEHAALLNAEPSALARVKRISVEYHQIAPKGTLFDHLESAGFVLRYDRILGDNYGVAEFARSVGT